MFNIFKYLIIGLFAIAAITCDNEPVVPDDPPVDPTKGILVVDFKLPKAGNLPEKRIHRVELCIGFNADSIYRKLFIDCANTSDILQAYTFYLPPGIYYYEAGITCSALNDSCSWGGFPGGRFGIRYSMVRVEIKAGKNTTSSPGFQ